jgi:hypothetical protein
MLKALLLAIVLLPQQEATEKIRPLHSEVQEILNELAYQDKDASLIPTGISQIIYDPTDNSIIARGTREAIAELRSLVAKLDSKVRTRVVLVSNNAASYIVALTKGQVPSVEVSVSPSQNGVVATGTPNDLSDLERLIKQLDVAPLALSLDVQVALPALGRRYSTVARVNNSAEWSYTDKTAAASVVVAPQVNADGTVTLSIKAGALDVVSTVTVRPRLGEQVYVHLLPTLRMNRQTNVMEPVISISTAVSGADPAAFLSGGAAGVAWSVQESGPVRLAPREAEVRIVVRVFAAAG